MIEFNDADVHSVQQGLNCSFEEPHVRFLKATTASDLHACPGSGKTTLLVAKLVLLARKWPWRDRGVLVLSHTNVARREVEQRLAKEPAAARLLGYPHFIGIIQGFVDRFLALPYLRDVGHAGAPVEEPRVDDQAFAERAERLFFGHAGWKDFPTARGWLKKRYPHDNGLGVISSLYYRGADLTLSASPSGGVPKDQTTPTARQLRTLKNRVAAEGIFRYADMFGFAAASLKTRHFVGDALRHRFPWVFVDEMQDTSNEQERLLYDLFKDRSVVFTKIGDMNQAIFAEAVSDVEQPELKWAQAIELPRSQRLAPKLATLVSPLAVVHPLALQGNEKRQDRTHTIFLFNNRSIGSVLPTFGDLILKEWDGSLPNNFVAKAVGFRRRPPEKAVVPASLVDYWADFAERPAEQPLLTTLLRAVRQARRVVEVEGEFFGAYRVVSGALARLLELHEGNRVTRRTLSERCREGMLDEQTLKRAMAKLLRDDCTSSADAWEKAVQPIRELLLSGKTSGDVKSYLDWETANITPNRPTGSHVFVHHAGSATVSIEVATIHAVKGETHDATLVLETLFHEHDVELAVPFLLRQGIKKKRTGRLVEHLKRLFVAATRPKELLCFAVHDNHVSAEQEQALTLSGWRIQRVAGTL